MSLRKNYQSYDCKLSIATILNFSSNELNIRIPSKAGDKSYNDKVFHIYNGTFITEIPFWKDQLKHSYMDDVKARYPKKWNQHMESILNHKLSNDELNGFGALTLKWYKIVIVQLSNIIQPYLPYISLKKDRYNYLNMLKSVKDIPTKSHQVQCFDFTAKEILIQMNEIFYLYNYENDEYNLLFKLSNLGINENFQRYQFVDYYFNSISVINNTNTISIINFFSDHYRKITLIHLLTINKSTKNYKIVPKFENNAKYINIRGSRSILIDNNIIVLLNYEYGYSLNAFITIFNLDSGQIYHNHNYISQSSTGVNGMISLKNTQNKQILIWGGVLRNESPNNMYICTLDKTKSSLKLLERIETNWLDCLSRNMILNDGVGSWYRFGYVLNKNHIICLGGGHGNNIYMDCIFIYDTIANKWYISEVELPKKLCSMSNNVGIKCIDDELYIHCIGGLDSNTKLCGNNWIIPVEFIYRNLQEINFYTIKDVSLVITYWINIMRYDIDWFVGLTRIVFTYIA